MFLYHFKQLNSTRVLWYYWGIGLFIITYNDFNNLILKFIRSFKVNFIFTILVTVKNKI